MFKFRNRCFVSSQTGSTLIGVALLTLVMGFLMTGGIYLLNTYDAVQTDIKSSEKTADLQAALRNFIDINKRYPCPTRMDIAPDQPGFGLEDCTITDVSGRDGLGVKIGAAPVRTLNVPDSLIVDGFGRRHIYAVTTDLTANDGSADVRNGLGAITIMHKLGDHEETLSNHEGYITYLLMSPGSDDRGAYDINGEEILPCETGTIAGENCDMSDATFYTTVTQSVGDSTDFTHNFAFAANTPAHYWYTGPWSECANKYTNGHPSHTQAEWNGTNSHYNNTAAKPECFSSSQERQVVCRDKQGNDAADENCNHTAKPIDQRTCAIDKCEWDIQTPSCRYENECGLGDMRPYSYICLDYQDDPTSLSVCNGYASQMDPKPPLPSPRNCPQRCCTQTNYDHEGNVINQVKKVYGTCADTYADPPPPIEEPDDPVVTDPNCGTVPSAETRTNDVGCPAGQDGANLEQERRTASFDASCNVVWSAWTPTGNDINTCRDPGDPPPPCPGTTTEYKDEAIGCPSSQERGNIQEYFQRDTTYSGPECAPSVGNWYSVGKSGTCETCTTTKGGVQDTSVYGIQTISHVGGGGCYCNLTKSIAKNVYLNGQNPAGMYSITSVNNNSDHDIVTMNWTAYRHGASEDEGGQSEDCTKECKGTLRVNYNVEENCTVTTQEPP